MPLKIVENDTGFPGSETYIDPDIDVDLGSRDFEPFFSLSSDAAALALLQSAIHRLQEAHWADDQMNADAVRAKALSYAVQAIANAARLPLEAKILALEARLAALEDRTE